jgi:hypothetical protein
MGRRDRGRDELTNRIHAGKNVEVRAVNGTRRHYVLLVAGTALFLLWLLFPLGTGDGGRWEVDDYLVTATQPDAKRDSLQAKYEAVFAKQAVIKASLYVAFLVLVLGHAILWERRSGEERANQP